MQWTEEQQRAIQARGVNILLSAAAGSGKTTVLVARVLELIGEGADIDRMLIVTFTRAAAADMRMKLAKKLGERAANGDELCRAQQLKLERALITTLHGFCSDFLRTHFESAGVDPAFRVLDDAETRRLEEEALNEAIEEAYAAQDEALDALDYGRGPKGVRALAEALLHTLSERPDPEAWLERFCRADDALIQLWMEEIKAAARRGIDRALYFTRLAQEAPDCTDNYFAALQEDLARLEALRALDEYDALYRAIGEFRQTAAKRVKGMAAGDEMKALRKSAADALGKLAIRELPLPVALADARALAPQLQTLAKITLSASEKFSAGKDELSGLSYSDLEHRTLRALESPDLSRLMRERFDHVFVDEYQDTSDVQEALVRRIARADNLFMVGDVKQSIYRFRQAEPRLFLEKYAAYTRGEGGMLLPLTMNFRSKPVLLQFVNRIFERAMQGGDSEIVYDALARLNPGVPDAEGGGVEIHLLSGAQSAEAEPDALDLKKCEQQALFIAGRIREMMRENPALRYRDFAVLSRTKSGVLGPMANLLMREGIPAYADGTEGFFASMEITLALSLLKLIANRRSDVELIGVLRSPAVGLSDEALAQIRIFTPDVPFADAAAQYAQRDNETGRRLKAFFERLDRWQLMSGCTDLGVLLRTALEESGIYESAGVLPAGAQRQANLDQLILNAAAFDATISGSLTRFLKHTEKLRERGDGDDAHLLGENDNVVQLMTVHKSKGLEFPVVFGVLLERRYSSGRRGDALTAHRELGVGCACFDPQLKTKRKTLAQLAMQERAAREDRAEELRILYVLLTRAQERLILLGSVRDAAHAQRSWDALREAPAAAGSNLDVIMSAAPEGLAQIFVHAPGDTPAAADAPAAQQAEAAEEAADPALVQALIWKYPDAQAAGQPLKLTVTGLLRELQGPAAREPVLERPAFLMETPGQLTGVERGTAYHRALQLLEIAPLRGLQGRALSAEIARQLDALTESGRISPAERGVVQVSNLARFLSGETGTRLLHAELLRREWPFNVLMRISEALTAEEAQGLTDAEILVQGTIDCCFEEGGKWILLDYKTDRSDDAAALTLRYRNQLRIYALALERITGREVSEIRLCLIRSGEELPVSRAAEPETVEG